MLYLRLLICSLLLPTQPVHAESLITVPVKRELSGEVYLAEGVVESVKTTQISTEMQGSITALPVKAGDVVKAGQLLARIDTRQARQQVVGSQAQSAAVNAQLNAARQTYERKQRLYQKHYISQAALEQAEAEYKSALAQRHAQQAEVTIANVRTELHTIVAPYSGVIAEVNVELGDMALPGKPLLTLYDAQNLRVVANLPESKIAQLENSGNVRVDFSVNAQSALIIPVNNLQLLPTADAVSHQKQVRVSLPKSIAGISPGTFARLGLPIANKTGQVKLLVPASAILRRGELSVVYIVVNGKPQLRQIRAGLPQEELIEILSGVEAGELVAVNPLAAVASLKAGK